MFDLTVMSVGCEREEEARRPTTEAKGDRMGIVKCIERGWLAAVVAL